MHQRHTQSITKQPYKIFPSLVNKVLNFFMVQNGYGNSENVQAAQMEYRSNVHTVQTSRPLKWDAAQMGYRSNVQSPKKRLCPMLPKGNNYPISRLVLSIFTVFINKWVQDGLLFRFSAVYLLETVKLCQCPALPKSNDVYL